MIAIYDPHGQVIGYLDSDDPTIYDARRQFIGLVNWVSPEQCAIVDAKGCCVARGLWNGSRWLETKDCQGKRLGSRVGTDYLPLPWPAREPLCAYLDAHGWLIGYAPAYVNTLAAQALLHRLL